MSRNGQGQYILPPSVNPVVPDTIIATAWANPTLDDIALALSTSIATDGQTPPTANLPMAGFRHTNVGTALAATQYAQAGQTQAFNMNIVTGVTNNVGGTQYSGFLPFGIGGTIAISPLMPVIFVPSINNGGNASLQLNGGSFFPILNADLTALAANQIKVGQPVALCYSAGNWILLTNTLTTAVLNGLYVPLLGGTMTGPLILSQAPSDSNGAATKAYVDAAVAGSVAGVASFNSRTGAVTLLSGDVIGALGYTPVNLAGATMTGNLTAPAIISSDALIGNRVQLNNNALSPSGSISVNGGFQTTTITLSGNLTISSIINVSPGNIARITFLSTNLGVVTWPAVVKWPLPTASAPDFAAGTQKQAVVVLEALAGGNFLANASVY